MPLRPDQGSLSYYRRGTHPSVDRVCVVRGIPGQRKNCTWQISVRSLQSQRGLCEEAMRRVVVVERPSLFARGLLAALGSILPDYDVLLANDLVSARREIGPDEIPELALVDVDMPDSTWESLRSLRRQYPRMRLLAMCDNANRADAIHCLENGLAGCFSKTQPVEEILEAIAGVLSGRFYAAPTAKEPEEAISTSQVPSSDQSVPLMSERDGDKLTPRQREILPLL